MLSAGILDQFLLEIVQYEASRQIWNAFGPLSKSAPHVAKIIRYTRTCNSRDTQTLPDFNIIQTPNARDKLFQRLELAY